MSAKITLLPIIRTISGRLGNLTFRTSPSGKTTVSTYKPQHRITPPSDAERNARQLFATRAEQVKQLRKQHPELSHKEAWKIVKSHNTPTS